jgi:Tfp pilus assembly PilM family ATPase
MFFARSRRTDVLPIGLHIGADHLRMVQFASGAGHPTQPSLSTEPSQPAVVALYKIPLPAIAPDPLPRAAAAAALLRQALRDGRFFGQRVATALPAELVHLRTFRLAAPVTGDQSQVDLASAALREARAAAPFGGGVGAYVEAVPVGEVRQGSDVRQEFLSVAARDADVADLLNRLGRVVQVESLQAEPFAIYRCVAWLSADQGTNATHAALYVGGTESLVLVGSGFQLRVVRRVGIGDAHLDRAVARKLGVTPADAQRLRRRLAAPASTGATGAPQTSDPVRAAVNDALRGPLEELARETALCVRYHAVSFRSPMPAAVRVLGCEARDPQLRSHIESASGLPVDPRGALDGLAWDPAIQKRGAFHGLAGAGADDGGWAVAIGLALKLATAPLHASCKTTGMAGDSQGGTQPVSATRETACV